MMKLFLCDSDSSFLFFLTEVPGFVCSVWNSVLCYCKYDINPAFFISKSLLCYKLLVKLSNPTLRCCSLSPLCALRDMGVLRAVACRLAAS